MEKTDQSVSDTEEFLKWVQGQYEQPCTSMGRSIREARIHAVITPRFVPTCSWELLCELGKLAKEYDALVQTHAAESVDEVTFGMWMASTSVSSIVLTMSQLQLFTLRRKGTSRYLRRQDC